MSDDETMLKPGAVNTTWENWHETVSGQIAGMDAVLPPPDGQDYGAEMINRCTRQIQRSIASAKVRQIPYKAIGRGWSLSEAPLTDGIMLNTAALTGKKRIHHTQVVPEYRGDLTDKRGLCLVQCGNYVSELNRWLENSTQRLSFKTTGAANGQTIVGATSAGTHGSVLDFGAMHDQIVSIHLLAGDTAQFWLERASYPVVKESVATAFGATLIRDNDLFNAVVVGLGAFGVIHNVVIEARPRFLVDAHNYDKDRNGNPLTYQGTMRDRVSQLDFASDTSLDPAGRSGKPYFFQPIINPNTSPPEILVTQMYEEPWKDDHVPDYTIEENSFGPGYDFITVAGRALDLFQPLVPMFSNLVASQMFNLGRQKRSWGETFGYKSLRTKVASGTVAVPLDRADDTIEILLQLNRDIGPVPLVFGCRYVKKSSALLAFNRWDATFVVSIDGVHNDDSTDFFDAIPAAMEAANIPFTQHWGKTHGYTPERVRAAYGDNAVDKWLAARRELLPNSADRKMFDNDYLRECGLAE
ncbi:FAD-binding protein [Pontixanthobacter aestiaquae]|uniref:FAD-binding protein n=1 Tax=Pontixanthobacter aestiaquae TaxID=1509367 RepID=A0A844Z2E9_9SPHN|nr:FAD-binding protein [Pontixanthobacter aestiaquae]MDN3647177.1 FAD-binding protein [Pontixanthobacter aestiaquae]MXO81848.1 FAD-binding protein [Pontixanthobacter aestiaquae]